MEQPQRRIVRHGARVSQMDLPLVQTLPLEANPRQPGFEGRDRDGIPGGLQAGLQNRLCLHESIALLEQSGALERAFVCPHGRPTVLRLSFEELEKRFGRR